MAVNLTKGQKISLDKEAGTALSQVFMGLGWDVRKGFFGGGDIDLDASCLLFGEDNQLVDAVWFKQLNSRDGSIAHSGDNLTGEGAGDDETITIHLASVPQTVHALIFTVNSFRGDTFEKVKNAYCRLVDQKSNQEVARYDLSESGSHTGLIMAKLYRHNGEWKMHAIGEQTSGKTFHDLIPLIGQYL